jgi:uncharacterized membrane protein SpoIIM required for sporulation
MDNKDLKMFGGLMLVLFLIAIVTGVTYIGLDQLKSTTCEQDVSTNVWEGGACVNETGGTAVTLTAITKIAIVESAIDIALGLLALVVLMAVFKVVIKTAKSFGTGL